MLCFLCEEEQRRAYCQQFWSDLTLRMLQEQLLQLVSEERERSQNAVEELIAEERLKLQVDAASFLKAFITYIQSFINIMLVCCPYLENKMKVCVDV